MIYQHKTTGKKREFVPGMKISDEWSPVQTMRTEHGVLSVSEVDPKSVYTHKSRKAAATRKKNAKAKAAAAKKAESETPKEESKK